MNALRTTGCLNLPPTYGELRRLAPIQREDSEEFDDFGEVQAIRRWIDFGSLSLGIFMFSNDPDRYVVSDVEVTDSHWAVTGPFRVGQPACFVREQLGLDARHDEDATWRHADDTALMQFVVTDGRIAKIRVRCHMG